MVWQLVCLSYELRSPLHIGYHKVGNVQRTRHYIPSRNLWGAVTERLTRGGFGAPGAPRGDYQKIGAWVQEHCVFTYFFVWDEEHLLYPCYKSEGLYYGDRKLLGIDFERRYLGVHVSTALDAVSSSAQAGSLHELEYIAHFAQDCAEPLPTHLLGWVFLDDDSEQYLGSEEKWREWLGELQVGGERRYGFGHLRLCSWSKEPLLPAGYVAVLNKQRPQLEVEAGAPLLAHVQVQGLQARGQIEPLVGRMTLGKRSDAFGRTLTSAQICWTPGAILMETSSFDITPYGFWTLAQY